MDTASNDVAWTSFAIFSSETKRPLRLVRFDGSMFMVRQRPTINPLLVFLARTAERTIVQGLSPEEMLPQETTPCPFVQTRFHLVFMTGRLEEGESLRNLIEIRFARAEADAKTPRRLVPAAEPLLDHPAINVCWPRRLLSLYDSAHYGIRDGGVGDAIIDNNVQALKISSP